MLDRGASRAKAFAVNAPPPRLTQLERVSWWLNHKLLLCPIVLYLLILLAALKLGHPATDPHSRPPGGE